MADSSVPYPLATLTAFLAGVGVLLLVGSVGLSALLLWHRVAAGSGDTYIVLPFWLPVAFVGCSVVVVIGSAVVRRNVGRHRKGSSAHRLASAAMLLTGAAWGVCGIMWVVAGL